MKRLNLMKKVTGLLLSAAMVVGFSAAAMAEEPQAAAIDAEAFDALVSSGPVADDAAIEANSWASAVKEAGVLRVGGTRTSFLFSQLDEIPAHVSLFCRADR